MVCIVPSAHVAQLGEHPPPGGRSTGWSCSGARCILLAWMTMVGGSGRHQDQNMMSVIGAGAEFSSVGSEGMTVSGPALQVLFSAGPGLGNTSTQRVLADVFKQNVDIASQPDMARDSYIVESGGW